MNSIVIYNFRFTRISAPSTYLFAIFKSSFLL
nr:MAG TPA: hypothetical protein [Bacteriophage sp.]